MTHRLCGRLRPLGVGEGGGKASIGLRGRLWGFAALSRVREDHVGIGNSASSAAVVIFAATVDPVTAEEVCGIAWPSICCRGAS